MGLDPIKTAVLEELVERFELAWGNDAQVEIESLVRSLDGDARRATLIELIRTEMELQFHKKQQPTTESFLQRFPELAEDPDARNEIAFEEYRQRHLAGHSIDRAVFADRYRISTDAWPEWESGPLPDSESEPTGEDIHEASRPQVGQRWHGFDIVAELGRGAFGAVFLAKQDALAGRLVVLKFSSIVTEEPQFLARLQHTHIVPVYSVHQTDSHLSICMPFLGVATLADLAQHVRSQSDSFQSRWVNSQHLISTVAQRRQETVERNLDDPVVLNAFRKRRLIDRGGESTLASFERWVIETMSAVLDGLGYAHSKGVVHGDLKPANILLSDDGEPIILDFHLAKMEGQPWSSHVGGTLPYMAPEHLNSMVDGEPFDSRADLFSAGVILHELLSGQMGMGMASSTLTDWDQLPKMIADRQQRIRSFQPCSDLHPDLQSIIAKSTAVEPGQRYQTADQMREDLQRHLTDRPLAWAPNRSWSVRFGKWVRRHPRLTSAASVAAMATVGLALLATVLWANWTRTQRLEAVQTHQQRLSDLQRAKIPLTAGRLVGLKPGDAAFDAGEQILMQIQPTTENTGSRPVLDHFRFLPASDQQKERESIAEIHFWLAETLREQAVRSESSTALLESALNHNHVAGRWVDGRGIQLQRAEILDQLDQPEEANRIRARAQSLPNENRLDRYLTAYLEGRDYRRASEALQTLIESDPLDVSAWLMLGHVHSAHRNFADADACYTVSVALEPNRAYPWAFRGAVRLEAGRYAESLDDFDRALEKEPNLVPAHLNRALALMRMRQWEAARAAFDRALELGARSTRIYYLRAQVRRQLGDNAGAELDLQTFRQSKPNDVLSWIVLGNLQIDQDPRRAVQNYEKALELNPDSLDALNNLAHVYAERLQDNAAALEALDRAVELDPRNPRRYCDRGVIRARLGNRSTALADARQALTLKRDAEVFYRVSGIYAQTSRKNPTDANQALNCLAAAIARNPAWVASQLGDDPDLEPLRQLDRFREITKPLAEIMENARPGS